MTKEQEEAIKYFEDKIKDVKPEYIETYVDGKKYRSEVIPLKMRFDEEEAEKMKIILNMLKENSAEIHQKNTELAEKNAEIEKYKKLLADNLAKNLNDSIKAKEKADTDLDDLDKGWKVELEKKDKMIDLLVNKLNQNCKVFENSEIKEIVEIYEEIKSTSDLRGIELRKNCIKQYFERKAKDGRL